MRWRPWIVGGTIVALGSVDAFLLAHEKVERRVVVGESRVVREDPLAGLSYRAGSRARNLERMGLPEDLVLRAMARMEALDRSLRRDLSALLRDADRDLALQAFCRSTGGLPPRYAALDWLVVESEPGVRAVVDPTELTELAPFGWIEGARVESVYQALEWTVPRKPDATVMGLAGLLAGAEAEVLAGASPWGRSLGRSWSFDEVRRRHPGVADQLVEYLALFHVLEELATSADGICAQG